jgi:hypothetical protein
LTDAWRVIRRAGWGAPDHHRHHLIIIRIIGKFLNYLPRERKMLRHFTALAIAAILSLGMMTPAPAGSCPGFGANCGCGPVIEVAAPCGPVVESYLVDQGPVFSGPGHYLHQLADPPPCCYPYVGPVYTGYPYGEQGPGYARGFYSPYAGYPYAEPYPYVGRFHHRAARRHVTRFVPVHRRVR